ncbi:MAG: hypothetical protein ACREGJ_04580 [Candidatus Saccharimonadales bacterium]
MDEKFLTLWEDPAKEIGELILDEAIEDAAPLVAKIPLLSLVVATWKSGRAWTDYLLAKKVQHFYEAWETLGTKERKQIFEKFKKKPRAFAEKLLFILDQQEDLAKCRILGELTVAYLQNHLKRGDYYDLIETVNRLSLGDLQKFTALNQYESLVLPQRVVKERYAALFISRGLLMSASRIPGEQRTSREPDYHLTTLGKKLADILGEGND